MCTLVLLLVGLESEQIISLFESQFAHLYNGDQKVPASWHCSDHYRQCTKGILCCLTDSRGVILNLSWHQGGRALSGAQGMVAELLRTRDRRERKRRRKRRRRRGD